MYAKDALGKALESLEAAAPYELGEPPPFQIGTLYPAYLRGQANLLAHNGNTAIAEFQKFLDRRGIVMNFPLGALAHLQLGRSYAMAGWESKRLAWPIKSVRSHLACRRTSSRWIGIHF